MNTQLTQLYECLRDVVPLSPEASDLINEKLKSLGAEKETWRDKILKAYYDRPVPKLNQGYTHAIEETNYSRKKYAKNRKQAALRAQKTIDELSAMALKDSQQTKLTRGLLIAEIRIINQKLALQPPQQQAT